jgi:hypothetical protein
VTTSSTHAHISQNTPPTSQRNAQLDTHNLHDLALYPTLSLYRSELNRHELIAHNELIVHNIIFAARIILVHHPQPREIWAIYLVLGYAVFNSPLGTLAPSNLPNHAAFMRSLRTREESGDCIVCWDTRVVADLSRKHRSCAECLQLMGQYEQTVCPLCRKPFFAALH